MAADRSRGHRFEATQALRQVLNRAVAWKLIDENPPSAACRIPTACREQRLVLLTHRAPALASGQVG
jgi:hypothetical protein